jgi:hypothetical protein
VVVPQGLKWIHPWPSADGKRIAYEDINGEGNHFAGYVRVSDQQAFRLSPQPRVNPAFLNSTLLWYAEETVCSAQYPCTPEPRQTGRTYIYDLVAQTESISIITSVLDSWPHVGAA